MENVTLKGFISLYSCLTLISVVGAAVWVALRSHLFGCVAFFVTSERQTYYPRTCHLSSKL